MRFAALLAICLSFSSLLTGCGSSTATTTSSDDPRTAQKYTIVTTCAMVTDIVEQVAGDQANVVGLMGHGVDPHLYKPTRNDRKSIMSADVVFCVGLMLEGKMESAFNSVASEQTPVVAVGAAIDKDLLRSPPEFEGHPDPHVWMDVEMWKVAVQEVADQLATYDADSADTYQANAREYLAELDKLHAYTKETLATIPSEQRVLITPHDAFGYFARAYGMQVMAVQGISTESQAGVKHINDLVDAVVANKIKAIFVESSVPKESIRAIIEGAAKRDWQVSIGGELFSDAMGKPGTYEGTYIGMIDHNTTVITQALGGKAPDGGMQGKLRGRSE